MGGVHPIEEAGSSDCENGCWKAKCPRAWEPDQVALGAGSLGGHKCGPLPNPHIDDLSWGVIEATQRGTMVVKAEQGEAKDQECSGQATTDIDKETRRLPMVGKPGVLGVLNCVECHVQMGGARAEFHAVFVLGNW